MSKREISDWQPPAGFNSVHSRREAHGIQLGWFHRYPARFSAEVLAQMFSSLGRREQPGLLLDPFAGTFATNVVARQLGIPSVGVEATPLGVLIGQVRTRPPRGLRHAVATIDRIADEGPFLDAPSEELVYWLGNENARLADSYRARLESLADPAERRFVRLALSAALRPASRWLASSIKPQVDPDRVPWSMATAFRRAGRSLAYDCSLEPRGRGTSVTVLRGDARQIPLPDSSVQTVATSPPYWMTYDYIDTQRISYLLFGWEQPRLIGQKYGVSPDGIGFVASPSLRGWYESEYRGELTAKGRSLRAYLVAMREHFREARRLLRDGGVAVYAVADSRRLGKPFPLTDGLVEIMRDEGFGSVSVTLREISRRTLPAGRDDATGRFSSEGLGPISEKVIVAKV